MPIDFGSAVACGRISGFMSRTRIHSCRFRASRSYNSSRACARIEINRAHPQLIRHVDRFRLFSWKFLIRSDLQQSLSRGPVAREWPRVVKGRRVERSSPVPLPKDKIKIALDESRLILGAQIAAPTTNLIPTLSLPASIRAYHCLPHHLRYNNRPSAT